MSGPSREPNESNESNEPDERGPAGEGPEGGRRVRGKPGTEAAKRVARERERDEASTRRASTPADPDEQTDFSGVEEKLDGPSDGGGS